MAVYLKGASVGHSHIGLTDMSAYRDYSSSWCFPPSIPLLDTRKQIHPQKKGERNWTENFRVQSLILVAADSEVKGFFTHFKSVTSLRYVLLSLQDEDPGPDTLLEPAAKPA